MVFMLRKWFYYGSFYSVSIPQVVVLPLLSGFLNMAFLATFGGLRLNVGMQAESP